MTCELTSQPSSDAVKVWIKATSLRVTVQPPGTGNLLDLLRWAP
jgi:hypothetical protein